ncbi:MAG: zinc dependent phospholipase C family protein [Ferruginibacter sp.]
MKIILKRQLIVCLFLSIKLSAYSWGFFAHQKLNHCAVFLLPPQMLVFYKPNILFITEHAVDPDKRRYGVAEEAPRHYIDIDYYGKYPFDALPRKWDSAVKKFSEDTLKAHGIVPWYVQTMLFRLTTAFREKNFVKILKYSAEIGHYIGDAHVPLHTSSNHNGQLTGQKGIHAFWESRIPELLADDQFDFFIGKASYINNPGDFIWKRILESAKAADSVLAFEKELSNKFPADKKYAFEERNGIITRQYSAAYTIAYNKKLNGMVERRMRQAIYCIASFWYTAWVNAGQPDLHSLSSKQFSENDLKEFELLNNQWKTGKMIGREEN